MSSGLTNQFIEDYTRLNATLPQGKRLICTGVRRGKPVGAPICSWLVSGQTGQGKSSIVSFLTLWFLAAGASILLIDPHAMNEERSLALKLNPLKRWFAYPVIDCLDVDTLMMAIEWLEQEYTSRKRSMAGKSVLLLCIDEWNELLSGCGLTAKQADRLIDLVSNLARGGAKFGLYVVLALHNTDLSSSGGPVLRRNFLGRCACAAEWREMSNSLDYSDLKHIKQLANPVMKPGNALLKVTGKPLTRVHFPYTDEHHVAQFAGIIEPIVFPVTCETCDDSAQDPLFLPPHVHMQTNSPTPLVSPPHDTDMWHIFHTSKQKTIRIEHTQYLEILQAGRAQLQQNEANGYRGINQKQLIAEQGWTNKNLITVKVSCVAREQGWVRYSEAELSKGERQALLAQAKHMCSRCGSTTDLTVDHITPRSKGGGNEPENLVVLCRACNSSKGITTQKGTITHE